MPAAEQVALLINAAHERFAGVHQGEVSQVYPALARRPAGLFGIRVVANDGSVHAVGDADHPLTIMSVSKPFVFASVCDLIGAVDAVSASASTPPASPSTRPPHPRRSLDGRTNPMVNPGAIATASLADGATAGERADITDTNGSTSRPSSRRPPARASGTSRPASTRSCSRTRSRSSPARRAPGATGSSCSSSTAPAGTPPPVSRRPRVSASSTCRPTPRSCNRPRRFGSTSTNRSSTRRFRNHRGPRCRRG